MSISAVGSIRWISLPQLLAKPNGTVAEICSIPHDETVSIKALK
ncbi:hypothetical protein [Collibacillus ludicampi]|nr:hypothetical protein [Collibacillus ludicampi]